MFSDFATPQRIGNVLTAGTPLLRLTVCGTTYIRDALTGDLVIQFPHTELDAEDAGLIEAQQIVMEGETK